ncbi:MAG: TIGR01777 family oxidoreductase [Planctomycetota bacterium]
MTTIAITGASGFVGTALAARLRARGHDVRRFVRGEARGVDEIRWDPSTGAFEADKAATVDAVVHLAGENVAAGRWSDARKRAIRDSRGPVTEKLCRALAELEHPPVLISASAVGFYGNRGDEVLDERSAPGTGFLAEVTWAWERATAPLEARAARVCHLRTGMVLGDGGALAKMRLPFRLCLGGPLGNGRQWISWIALDDLCSAITFLLADPTARGAYLCVAPEPVTNLEFAVALGAAMHRPAWLPTPAFALRGLFGEMADALLLGSQRALPRRLLEAGFAFAQPEVGGALRSILR